MAFALTDEQRQEIQAGFDTLIPYTKGERNGPYDSWSGIELQLKEHEPTVDGDGKRILNIFYMSKPEELLERAREEENPNWMLSFSIQKVVLKDN